MLRRILSLQITRVSWEDELRGMGTYRRLKLSKAKVLSSDLGAAPWCDWLIELMFLVGLLCGCGRRRTMLKITSIL